MKEDAIEDVQLTRLSSKGQIVIPQAIRKKMNMKEGNVFAVTSPKEGTLILKKIDRPFSQEDISLLRDLEEAWEDIEKGNFRRAKRGDFLAELDKW